MLDKYRKFKENGEIRAKDIQLPQTNKYDIFTAQREENLIRNMLLPYRHSNYLHLHREDLLSKYPLPDAQLDESDK